jgi:hypothetical protein
VVAYVVTFVLSVCAPQTVPQPPLEVRQHKQELRERFPEPMVLKSL